ncbi:uncharacterized protein L203_102592 [Cryptococcus depauperatus CBS 7841]|uniref:Uncharacterized protein n=1 Tax=Cryptococcus depauperatus CBS 7841 TaxID=1295531 RepID=A0A1E3IDN9_9TREE|nr:hypothetical protein L203_03958 [Cryptococcus depauperatus CBS 7841]
MPNVIYNNDLRYPGPPEYPASEGILGLPTQTELDGYPRMFTWGELKEIIQGGQLERLMRNKEMQWKYDQWSAEIRIQYGSTENYLNQARLPFRSQRLPETDNITRPSLGRDIENTSNIHSRSSVNRAILNSGTMTSSPTSFVSLSALGKLKNETVNGLGDTGKESKDDKKAIFLTFKEEEGLDPEKYAVVPNDWPYCVPYGVRHFCVWSRVPIAHPKLVNYSSEDWDKIEEQGLGGFTGVTPVFPHSKEFFTADSSGCQPPGRSLQTSAKDNDWYAIDVAHGGYEMQRWAGVQYESNGGTEVGKMIRGLWDERGWECLWFVNPLRLQSVPGFDHFHVFARRKSPEEIDAAEKAESFRSGR